MPRQGNRRCLSSRIRAKESLKALVTCRESAGQTHKEHLEQQLVSPSVRFNLISEVKYAGLLILCACWAHSIKIAMMPLQEVWRWGRWTQCRVRGRWHSWKIWVLQGRVSLTSKWKGWDVSYIMLHIWKDSMIKNLINKTEIFLWHKLFPFSKASARAVICNYRLIVSCLSALSITYTEDY